MKTPLLVLLLSVSALIIFKYVENSLPTVPKATVTVIDSSTPTPIPQIDFQASFAIYTHGTYRIFTDSRYHNLSDKVYLQAEPSNIIYIKEANITWGDFFATLPMEVTQDCLITGTKQSFCTGEDGTLDFYINGEKVDNFLDRKIKEGDKALITFGNNTEEAEIEKQLQSIPNIIK